MLQSKRTYYLLLSVVQVLLLCIAFKDFRIHPQEIMFNNIADGLKNYFTLLSYVQTPFVTPFSYDIFNYPFGEFIFTTDNTPLFSIPFKWFCQNILDLSAYTIPVYNLFIISNILVCSLFAASVFRRLTGNKWLAFVFALLLSWTNMQVQRIWAGHFNLSLSSLILIAIWLHLRWTDARANNRRKGWIAGGMVLLNILAFLAHGYYIAIIGIFQAAMLFISALYEPHGKERWRTIGFSALIPVVALGVVLVMMMTTDGFYHQRQPGAAGYDWMEHKVRFLALFSHYDFQTVFFPFRAMQRSHGVENEGYLGNLGVFSLFSFLAISIAHRPWRNRMKEYLQQAFSDQRVAAIVLGGFFMLIVSFGERYYTEDLERGVLFYNFLNPLYLLHQFTDAVAQFRDLGRFAWPFFWSFNLLIAYLLSKALPALSSTVQKLVWGVILFLAATGIKDFVDALQAKATHNNPLNPAVYKARLGRLQLDPKRYQAMLALPYFNVGSENMETILDDQEEVSVLSYQMALQYRLPMMNVKLSRTVPRQAQMLDSFIAFDAADPQILEKMNNQPVLVFLDRRWAADSNLCWRQPTETAKNIYRGALALPARHALQPIDSLGDVVFYEWYPKR